MTITPGDRVYRPRKYRLMPKNAAAMIRAEEIEHKHPMTQPCEVSMAG
jgi:hypothetical protein